MIDYLTSFKILRHLFNLACFSAAFSMSVFWCHRFWKNEDLCLVDYVPYETTKDIPHPMISICVQWPFIESKFEAYNTNSIEYVEFIRGNKYYPGLEKIEFQDVTIDPNFFYLGDSLQWRNGTYKEGDYPNHVNKLPYVTFSGFWYYIPIKCYGMELQDKTIKYAYFALNSTFLKEGNDLSNDPDYCVKKKSLVAFHLPNQILLSSDTINRICLQNIINVERAVDLKINNLEILQRRNKHNDPCITNHETSDNNIINRIINKIGCTPPYLDSWSNLTMCKTKEQLANATMMLDLDYIADHLRQACLSIGDIRYTKEAFNPNPTWRGTNWSWISITTPKKIKLIRQVRDVDFQTVIGNAGGYVGLFLGR